MTVHPPGQRCDGRDRIQTELSHEVRHEPRLTSIPASPDDSGTSHNRCRYVGVFLPRRLPERGRGYGENCLEFQVLGNSWICHDLLVARARRRSPHSERTGRGQGRTSPCDGRTRMSHVPHSLPCRARATSRQAGRRTRESPREPFAEVRPRPATRRHHRRRAFRGQGGRSAPRMHRRSLLHMVVRRFRHPATSRSPQESTCPGK